MGGLRVFVSVFFFIVPQCLQSTDNREAHTPGSTAKEGSTGMTPNAHRSTDSTCVTCASTKQKGGLWFSGTP